MIRATTPTIQFIMPAGMYDGSKEILITFKQGKNILFDKLNIYPFYGCIASTRIGYSISLDKTEIEANRYDIHLSQKETSMFDPLLALHIQVRFLTIYGEAYASNEKLMSVCDVLNDKEMI